MADEKKAGVRLWGPEGGVFDEAEIPQGDAQPDVIQHEGKFYVWNQRNGQYREATVAKASSSKAAAPKEPEKTSAAVAEAHGADSARPTTAGDLAGAHEVKPTSTAADVTMPKKG